MRQFLAAFAALCLLPFAPLAQAATITTQGDLAIAIAAAKPGDVLTLEGVAFTSIPLSVRPADLTLNCGGKATFTGNTYAKNVQGLSLLGCAFTGAIPLRIDYGRDITVGDGVFTGPAARTGNAMSFTGVKGVRITGSTVKDFKNALVLLQVDGVDVQGLGIEGMAADGVHGVSVWNGTFRFVTVHGSRHDYGVHADGMQFYSQLGVKPTSNLLITDSQFTGDIQGLIFTNPSNGGVDGLTIRRTLARVAYANGLGLNGIRGGVIEDSHVETYPMAAYQARLYVAADSTVTYVGAPSTYAAYRNKPGWSSAPLAPAPAP